MQIKRRGFKVSHQMHMVLIIKFESPLRDNFDSPTGEHYSTPVPSTIDIRITTVIYLRSAMASKFDVRVV